MQKAPVYTVSVYMQKAPVYRVSVYTYAERLQFTPINPSDPSEESEPSMSCKKGTVCVQSTVTNFGVGTYSTQTK